MKFYKIAILFIILFNICVASCAAESNWVEMYSANKGTIYLDISNHKIFKQNNHTYINCWVKLEIKDSPGFLLSHIYFNVDTLEYLTKEEQLFGDGILIDSSDATKDGWKKPGTRTNMEHALRSIATWINDNAETYPPEVE